MRIMPSGYVMSKVMQPPSGVTCPSSRQSEDNVLETACLRGSQSSAHTHSRNIEVQELRVDYLRAENVILESFLQRSQGCGEVVCILPYDIRITRRPL